jgi:intracellular multiplication protein IcmL
MTEKKAPPKPALRPSTQQRRPAPQKKSEGARPTKPAAQPNGKQSLHGAEAVAALVVVSTNFSRFKNWMILLLVAVTLFSLAWNSVQFATQPEPKLLGMTSDGRIQELPLLDAPIDSRSVIIEWAGRNIPKLYDFNYVNYRGQLNKSLEFTAQNTLLSFQRMLDQSGILPKVRDEFLILRAVVENEPVVLGEDVIKGVRVWLVELPINLIYDSGATEADNKRRRQITQKIIFRAWIARASPLEYDGGLMLAKFVVQPRKD